MAAMTCLSMFGVTFMILRKRSRADNYFLVKNWDSCCRTELNKSNFLNQAIFCCVFFWVQKLLGGSLGNMRYDLGSGLCRNMMKNNQFWFEFSCLDVNAFLTLDISLSYIILQRYITRLPKRGHISFFLHSDPDKGANIVPRASPLEKWEGSEPWGRG